MDTSNIISTDGTSPVERLSGSNSNVAIYVLFPISIFSGMYLGPSFAMTQGLVTLRMRAVAAAILLFVLNIIGMGLGPTLVGWLSDLLMPYSGEESIRYALLFQWY